MELFINVAAFDKSDDAIFYYIGIGTANYSCGYPDPNMRHEYPDYVRALRFTRKVLILIDENTKNPLNGYGIELKKKYENIKYENYEAENLLIHIIKENIYIDTHEKYIKHIIEKALNTHRDSLVLISNFTGYNWYYKQNEFDSKFNEFYKDRFLLDSRYMLDTSCFHNLTEYKYQPIIQNGRFYIPRIDEVSYKLNLYEILNSSEPHDIIMHKKLIMKQIFYDYINKYMDKSYIMLRIRCNESADVTIRSKYRDKMLIYIKYILKIIDIFIGVDEILNKFKNSNIHNDFQELKNIIYKVIYD